MPDLVSFSMVNRLFAGTVNLNDPVLVRANALVNVLEAVRFLVPIDVVVKALANALLNDSILFASALNVNSLPILAVAVRFLVPDAVIPNALLITATPVLVLLPLALTENATSR